MSGDLFVDAQQVANFAAALLEGDTAVLTKLIAGKLEKIGEDFILDKLSGAFGPSGKRIGRLLLSSGSSEFESARDEWLTKALGLQTAPPVSRGDKRYGKSTWALTREDWLENKWRHDWRSQPRDPATGRWLPGRLEYIDPNLRYRGTRAGRSKRRKERRRAMLRARNNRFRTREERM